MALNLTQVHEFAAKPGAGGLELIRENHYVRLKGEGAEAPLYIQHGQVYGESGPAIHADEIPAWFWAEVEKCSSASLAAAGWEDVPKRR